jgi:ATP-binding cassette, subfamily F, member 3
MIAPDGGQRQVGHKVTLSYFAQHQLDQLDRSHTVWQEASSVGGDRTYGAMRNLLAAFLFRDEEIEKKVSVLSGGEKSRLVILKMLLSGANFLLLDEPTNHLDIPSRDVLEDALQAFSGTLCLITHDRHLINALANKTLYLRNGKPEVFPGNYQDFEEIWKPRLGHGQGVITPRLEISNPEANKGTLRKSQEEKRQEAEKRNVLFRRQAPLKKEIEALEERLTKILENKGHLEKYLADPETYKEGSNIGMMIQDYNIMEKEVAELTACWEAAVMKLEALEEE